MRKTLIALALIAMAPSAAALAQASAAIASGKASPSPLAPSEIVAAAPKADWTAIAPGDLMVMDLAPDAKGRPRRVVIQLIPPPFSQGWIGNIRKLVAARFWDGTAVNRVQDNYVVQWGDPNADDTKKARALPADLAIVPETDYVAARQRDSTTWVKSTFAAYAPHHGFLAGWPIAWNAQVNWPVHCYGMVGVGRDLSPNTGSGAELYTVIGHAPRHLDRNIALVGRVIEGIEHLSSLPRGHGALGFYDLAQGDERVGIVSVRLGNELKDMPAYEYLSTERERFARYADARANRRDAFFIRPAGGADICNVPVPVRRVK
jgi:peptidylprolyl isomerase